MKNKPEPPFKVTKVAQGSSLILHLEGHLDSATTRDLNVVLETSLRGVKNLIFDMSRLESISSAGLRSLLVAQKAIGKQGRMVIRDVNEIVMETFHSIGFDRIMTIE